MRMKTDGKIQTPCKKDTTWKANEFKSNCSNLGYYENLAKRNE